MNVDLVVLFANQDCYPEGFFSVTRFKSNLLGMCMTSSHRATCIHTHRTCKILRIYFINFNTQLQLGACMHLMEL